MIDDPIVEEVHRVREQMLAEYNGDLHALICDARLRTEEVARAGGKIYLPHSADGDSIHSGTKKAS